MHHKDNKTLFCNRYKSSVNGELDKHSLWGTFGCTEAMGVFKYHSTYYATYFHKHKITIEQRQMTNTRTSAVTSKPQKHSVYFEIKSKSRTASTTSKCINCAAY